MKKIFLSLICFCFGSSVFAGEAMIYNMSQKYDVEVVYQFCQSKSVIICKAQQVLRIRHKSYQTLSTEDQEFDYLEITSAIEKNKFGQPVSWSDFAQGTEGALCATRVADSSHNLFSGILVLNDMNESPYVLCNKIEPNVHVH